MIQPIPTANGSGYGQRLRNAREAAGLAIEEVAQRLKMPVRVVAALEAEDREHLGAPVFVRGQLRSYARLLGVPLDGFESALGSSQIPPTTLVSRTRTPRLQRIADQVGGRLVYIVITALIVLPIWVATQSHLGSFEEDAASLDLPADNLTGSPAPSSASPTAKPPPSTVVASMASLPSRQPVAPALSLRFSDDSWVRIVAPDGTTLEQALLKSGDTRSYQPGQVGRMVLGNAASIEVRHSGDVQDLAPFIRANVARFTVSSDGSLAASAN
ncbi:MAG: helix-turn-helix domain-containing protein [Luteimonas sp.]